MSGLTLRIIKPGATVNVLDSVIRTVQIYDFTVAGDVIPESIITAKGMMIAGAAANDPRGLAVGGDGQVLTADAASTPGVKWAAPATSGLNTMLNNSGGNLAKGAVVVWDTAANSAFKTSTTEGDTQVCGVLAEAINSAASGKVATGGTIETGVLVTGNVTRGNWLVQSTSAGRLKDSGSATPVPGGIAKAMTGYAGGGSGDVVAYIGKDAKPVASQFWLSGAGGWPSATAPCADSARTEMPTNDVNFKTLDFDQTTQEHAEWTFAMPSDYGGGTITALFHWTANSTSTNSVIWGLQARCFTDDDALDQAFGTAQEVTDANKATAYDLNITAATAAITIAGTPAAGKLVQWKAYRKAADGSDNLAADARLIGIQITYTRA